MMKASSIQKSYRFYAPFYDRVFGPVFEPGRKQATRQLTQREGMRILEVGVGTGLSIPYYEPNVKVTGIDISPEMLAKARKAYPPERYPCVQAFLEMDAQALQFEDNSFDVAVVQYVASVVPDPQAMMREIARVCVNGADVLVLNHFASERGFFRFMERTLAPFSNRLGFRTNLPLPEFLQMSGMQVRNILPVNLGGYWRLVHLKNLPPQGDGTGALSP